MTDVVVTKRSATERRTTNAPGTDSYKFRAVNRASGEVCVARVNR